MTLPAVLRAADSPAGRAPGSALPPPAGGLRVPPSSSPGVPRAGAPVSAPATRSAFKAVQRYHAAIASIERTSPHRPMVDLRSRIAQFGLNIRDQGNRGTCSVFAMTFLLEYALAKAASRAPGGIDLSEEYLNTAANIVSKTAKDGDFFDAIDAGYQQYGVVAEADMPYQGSYAASLMLPSRLVGQAQLARRFPATFIKPWNADVGATAEQLDRVLSLLDRDIPVAGGFWWPGKPAWETRKHEGVDLMATPPVSAKKVSVFDGHSVPLVGYLKHPAFRGGGYLVFRNSWGAGWGDHGHGYMPFDYVLRFANDLVFYRH